MQRPEPAKPLTGDSVTGAKVLDKHLDDGQRTGHIESQLNALIDWVWGVTE